MTGEPLSQVPHWPVPGRVRARMSWRTGGVSRTPWDGLNLGDHVGDDPVAVAHNRARWAAHLGARPVYLQQVHGAQLVRLDAASPHGLVADACLTRETGLACTILVADCLPLLLCDAQGRWVAAAHAGWRGLAGQGGHGVIESVVAAGLAEGSAAEDIRVWLGPCIGPAAFEVGPEVREAFMAADAAAALCFVPQGDRFLADLPGLARQRLARLGIRQVHGHDGTPEWCTVTQASRFFSHRRDARILGASGRLAASIWLQG